MVSVLFVIVLVLASCSLQPMLATGGHFDMRSEADGPNYLRLKISGKGSNSHPAAKGDDSNELVTTQTTENHLGATFNRNVRSLFWPLQIKEYRLTTAATTNTKTAAATTTTTDGKEISPHYDTGPTSHYDLPEAAPDDGSKSPFEETLLGGVAVGCDMTLFCQFDRCPNVQFNSDVVLNEEIRRKYDVTRRSNEMSPSPLSDTDSTQRTAIGLTDSMRPTTDKNDWSMSPDTRPWLNVTGDTVTSRVNESFHIWSDVYDVDFLNPSTRYQKDSSPTDLSCPADHQLGGSCSCDRKCVIYGDCCVDVFYSCNRLNATEDIIHFIRKTSEKSTSKNGGESPNKNSWESPSKNNRESLPNPSKSVMSPEDHMLMTYGACVMVRRYPEQHVMMVGICAPQNVSESAPRGECQSDHALLPPVVGDVHGARVTFKNVFCALCHGLDPDDLIVWSVEIHCGDVISHDDVTAMSEVDVIRRVEVGVCNMTYHHPDLTCQPRYCQPRARLNDEQRSQLTHNVASGLCSADDELLCRSYVFPDGGYKNPHCRKCLAVPTAARTKRQALGLNCEVIRPPVIRGGVFLILDLFGRYSGSGGSHVVTFNLCGDSEVYDPLAQTCRTLLCTRGYKPHQGRCQVDTAVVPVLDGGQQLFPNTWRLLKFSTNVTSYWNVSCGKIMQDLNTSDAWSLVNISLSLLPGVKGQRPMERDNLDLQCSNGMSPTNYPTVVSVHFLTELKPEVSVGSLPLVQKMSRDLMTYLGASHATWMWVTNMIKDEMCQDHARLVTYTDASLTYSDNATYAVTPGTPPSFYPVSHVGFDVTLNDLYPGGGLELRAVHVCREDEFDDNCSVVSYSINETTFNSSHLIILATNQVYAPDKFKVRGGSVLVCSEFKFARRSTVSSLSSGDLLYRTLSWVMTSLACLFLLAMVVLYCVFPELATLPGKMTASLAGTMMMTFLFNLLTLVDVHVAYVCPVLAVVSHVVTLAHFGWMSAIALHMALTFGSRAVTSHGQRNSFLLYNVAVWGGSVTIVVTSVGLDLSHSDNPPNPIGPMVGISENWTASEVSHVTSTSPGFPRYGYPHCTWFSGAMWTRLAFVIGPFALTYVINVVCYSITLAGIHKSSQNSAKVGKRRSDLARCLIYFKLSTAMGFAWILSLLINFAPEEEALPYLFVVLVFLQGVMLFMAFMGNSRVYRVVTGRIKMRTAQRTTTDSKVVSSVYTNQV